MAVYVDELMRWPTKIRCFQAGSCHLTADTVEELHAFAKRIGMKRSWFQPQSHPHYDLTPSKRERALALGAKFVSGKEQARERLKKRTSLVSRGNQRGSDVIPARGKRS